MKIGIFDSGLGGLHIAKSIRDVAPELDLVYFGDTLHVPYGNRSRAAIYELTVQAVHFLFEQDCRLIIMACNTASAAALRKIQQEWLPLHYPDRRILGVVVPTIEDVSLTAQGGVVGLFATRYVVDAGVYDEELRKINPQISLKALAVPLLVPLIENDGWEWMDSVLERYLAQFDDVTLEALILGCTHYGLLRERLQKFLPQTRIVSQGDIVPAKLLDYLERHPEHEGLLTRSGQDDFFVTDVNRHFLEVAESIYGYNVDLRSAGQGYMGRLAA